MSGDNRNLTRGTTATLTLGAVLTPCFLPGLTISGDYYNIVLEDVISAVTVQDTINSCYDLATFPNKYCDLFMRWPPEWLAVGSADSTNGPFSLECRLQYIRYQTLAGMQIETFKMQHGDVALATDAYFHDISFNLEVSEQSSFTALEQSARRAVIYQRS